MNCHVECKTVSRFAIKVLPLGLLACVQMLGQGVRVLPQLTVTTPGGGVVPNPTFRVCIEPASGTNCAPTANLFLDRGMTVATTNPIPGDQVGNIPTFFVAPGLYHIQINGQGIQQIDLSYVSVADLTLPVWQVAPAATCSSTASLDPTVATIFPITLTGNCTASLINVTAGVNLFVGKKLTLKIAQDSVGGRTFTCPAGFLNCPVVTNIGANNTVSTDFFFDGTNWNNELVPGQVQLGGDLGNTTVNPQVLSTHIVGATPNAIMKANATGNMVNSACTDNGVTVSCSEPLNLGANSLSAGAISGTTGTFGGAVIAQSLNGDPWVGSGIGQYSSMAACYAAISSGQVCHVTAGWSETFAANLVLSKNNTGFRFHGAATITMGSFQITKASLVHGVSIEGTIPPGQFNPITAPVQFVYTGNGAALSLGDSSADSNGVSLKNIFVKITGAGNSAHCIDIFRTQLFKIDYVVCTGNQSGVSNQIGLVLDGTGNFTGDSDIRGFRATGTQIGVQGNNNANINTFTDLECSIGATGNICLDVEGGSAWSCYGCHFEGGATGVKLNTSGAHISFYNEGNTTDVNFTASSNHNYVETLVAPPSVADSSPISSGNTAQFAGTRTLLYHEGPGAAITGNGGIQNLFTGFTLPGNTLGPGKGMRITCGWFHSTGTASTAYSLQISGANAFGAPTSTGVDNSQMEYAVYELWNNAGVQNAQVATGKEFTRTANIANVSLNNTVFNRGTDAINFVNNQTINCGFNVAATDQVTPEFFLVELVQ